MAQQVRLHVSLIAFLILILIACKSDVNKQIQKSKLITLNIDSNQFESKNGILFYNSSAYSGKAYTLYPVSKDTFEIKEYLNGKEHGKWTRFYQNNQLKELRYFNNGLKTADLLSWWPNGKKQMVYHFKNNEYEGNCREWNNAGRLIIELNYKNGYEEGSQKMFYDNGKVRANYVIKNGRRFGLLGTKNCVNVSKDIFKN
jgi:antitoxin component YwqK of YwqJK toxin-antitoxin module